MKKGLVWLLVLLAASSVLAGTEEAAISKMAKEVKGQEIPSSLGWLLADEKINFYIVLESGEKEILGLTIKNKKIESLERKELAEPSLKVYLKEKTLQEVQKAAEPAEALKKAWENKEIAYEAVGFWNKIKFGMVSLFTEVTGYFKGKEKTEGSKIGKEPLEEEGKEEEVKAEKEKKGIGEKEEIKKEEVEKETVNKTVNETETINETKAEEKTIVINETEENKKGIYVVEMTSTGFGEKVIEIGAGETVIWKNVREGRFDKAMVIGTQTCSKVKSSFFSPGESFNWTFKEAGTCLIVDGLMTTQSMKVVIE